MKARSIFLTTSLGLSVIVAGSALLMHPTKEIVSPTGDQFVSESSNAEFIVFTTDRDNPSILEDCRGCEEIYTMLPDGSNLKRLTSNNFNDLAAAWSPAAKTIAFHTNRIGGYPQIFLMNADGSDQRLLADSGINDKGEQLGAAFPSWSPSGDRLCFTSRLQPRELFIVDVASGKITRLTNDSDDDFRCQWSPLGDRLAFGSTRDGNKDIYVINVDGSNPFRLTVDAGANVHPAWSPDGNRIAFESDRDGDPEIYVMNADGTDQVRLTNFVGRDTMPSWSPKGDRIAFHRRIAGHGQVFTMNADGTDVTQLTFGTTIESSGFPNWAKGKLDR